METIGERVKRLRKEVMLTGGMLALRSGISQSTVYAVESRGKETTARTAYRLARGLGVTVDELLKGTRDVESEELPRMRHNLPGHFYGEGGGL